MDLDKSTNAFVWQRISRASEHGEAEDKSPDMPSDGRRDVRISRPATAANSGLPSSHRPARETP
jgi:hypothetical protein